MRLAAVAMYFATRPEEAIKWCGESSRTTHGTRVCIDACRYFGGLIMGALHVAAKEELLSERYCPRQIAAGTGLSRNTVRKYLGAAQAEGIAQDGLAPDDEQLVRLVGISLSGPRQVATPRQDLLEPWADQIYQWITNDRLQMTRIHELLAMRGCVVS